MKKYIRFGEIPKDGKSVNYFKLTFDQQDELDYEDYPEESKELGLSVFEIHNNMPALNSLQLITSLHARVKEGYRAYIVEGDEISKGNDGEPLLENVKIVEEYGYNKSKMYEYIIDKLKNSYKNVSGEQEGEYIGQFWEYPDNKPICKTVCNGLEFLNPVDDFDDMLGCKK